MMLTINVPVTFLPPTIHECHYGKAYLIAMDVIMNVCCHSCLSLCVYILSVDTYLPRVVLLWPLLMDSCQETMYYKVCLDPSQTLNSRTFEILELVDVPSAPMLLCEVMSGQGAKTQYVV